MPAGLDDAEPQSESTNGSRAKLDQRLTLLVNVWVNHKPLGLRCLPKSCFVSLPGHVSENFLQQDEATGDLREEHLHPLPLPRRKLQLATGVAGLIASLDSPSRVLGNSGDEGMRTLYRATLVLEGVPFRRENPKRKKTRQQ